MDFHENAAQREIMPTIDKFWMIFNCPELHNLIFNGFPQCELKKLMLVNHRFSDTLRPLFWKTIDLNRPWGNVPSKDVTIQYASLVRNLSTSKFRLVQFLAASGTCTRLKSLKINKPFDDSKVGDTDQDIWTLVQTNRNLECFWFTADHGKSVLFAKDVWPSLMGLPEWTSGQDSTFFQRISLTEIFFNGIEFGQSDLNQLVELCPNLTALSIEYCTYTKGTNPFNGNQIWNPQKLTSLKVATHKPYRYMYKICHNWMTLRFQRSRSRSTLERLELIGCSEAAMNALQHCLIEGMTDLQELFTVDSSTFSWSSDEDLEGVVHALALYPNLKELRLERLGFTVRCMDTFLRSLYTPTLTTLLLCKCDGLDSSSMHKILIHFVNLREVEMRECEPTLDDGEDMTQSWGCKGLRKFTLNYWGVDRDNNLATDLCTVANTVLQQLGQLLELTDVCLLLNGLPMEEYEESFLENVKLLEPCTRIQRLHISGVPPTEAQEINIWCKETWPIVSGGIWPLCDDNVDEEELKEYFGNTGFPF